MEDNHANHWQATITLRLRYQIHTSTKHAQKSYPTKKYYDIKEKYLNILNELPELPSMPDIGEPGVILVDVEQWKSDIELLRKLLPGVPQ